MDQQHVLEVVAAALTGPAAIAAWSGVGKVVGAIAKRRADADAKAKEAAAKKTEAEADATRKRAEAELVEAQAEAAHRSHADDTLRIVVDRLDRDMREVRGELAECHEQRAADRAQCAEETTQLRSEIGRMGARLERVERRTPPGGFPGVGSG